MQKIISLKKKIIISSLFAFTFFTMTLHCESFRVGKTHIIKLNSDISSESETSAKIGINEALAVYLPDDKNFTSNFIEGIEIKMDIPEAVASWLDSVACSVYDKVKPLPATSQIDYSATRQYVSTLPGRLSWVLQIPLKQENSIKANKYTTKIDTVPEFLDNVIFVRLQPVMKGVPEETLNAKITMTVKPVLLDKGLLHLNLHNTEEDFVQCSVYLDDKLVKYSETEKSLLVPTGVHTISIISDSYRNEVRTVRIEQAKTTNLDILMKSTEPTLLINAPEAAEVYLDDIKYDLENIGKENVISEGEHKVRFVIGNYEIIRTIQAFQGKTYTANFSVDLEISEE